MWTSIRLASEQWTTLWPQLCLSSHGEAAHTWKRSTGYEHLSLAPRDTNLYAEIRRKTVPLILTTAQFDCLIGNVRWRSIRQPDVTSSMMAYSIFCIAVCLLLEVASRSVPRRLFCCQTNQYYLRSVAAWIKKYVVLRGSLCPLNCSGFADDHWEDPKTTSICQTTSPRRSVMGTHRGMVYRSIYPQRWE